METAKHKTHSLEMKLKRFASTRSLAFLFPLIIWQKRKLTLYGKINIVKTLGLSKLIFNASVLHMPDHFIEQINKITFNFIWDGKPSKIKRTTIIGKKKDGGLRMCDFSIMNKALKIAWINRIQTQSSAAWKIIPDYSRLNGNLAFFNKL